MRVPHPFLHHPIAFAVCALAFNTPLLQAQVQNAADTSDASLPAVSVQARPAQEPQVEIAGWPATPGWQQPVQAQRFGQEALRQAGAQRLADLTQLDASTSDSYNSIGYWDGLSVRGFALDQASNFRREGLPINAETRLALDNKQAVELLKGTSGLQAGISAPGGLVNLLVKRPEARVREGELALTGGSSAKAAVDLGERWGERSQFGARLNAALETLRPDTQGNRGQRHLVALATDWRLGPDSLLEAEIEHSRHLQPSTPGLSAFGDRLPSAKDFDPGLNLNRQPWSQAVDMRGLTGSLRWTQRWSPAWRSQLSYGQQNLRTDDRAAFPFGCSSDDGYLADRFCADGGFDLYDFRSDGERRRTRALQAHLDGDLNWGRVRHQLRLGVLRSLHRTDLSNQAFNTVTTTRVGAVDIIPDGAGQPFGFEVADRHERSTEWLLQDSITLDAQWRAWLGVRHTQLQRRSVPTAGSASTQRSEHITTPWVALGYALRPQTQLYVSWGQGAELKTAPLDPSLVDNPGEILPVARSRQLEVGVKSQGEAQQWGVSAFRIHRPEIDVADGRYQLDGHTRTQGLDAFWQARMGAWQVRASGMVLDARREGSVVVNAGKRPVNVPRHAVKLGAAYRIAEGLQGAWPVTLQGDLVHEGSRWVDPANTLSLPSWTRVDLAAQAVQRAGSGSGTTAITWRVGVKNLLDRRAWVESPNSFRHIWLFPMQARTLTASMHISY